MVYPDERYEDSDVIDAKTEIENEVAVNYVLLPADYTIEIKDYKRVPTEVTRRQARRALLQAGLLDIVENYMQTTAPRETKIDWEDSQVFRRDWNSLPIIASALGLTDEEIDNLFILAETL